VRSAITTSSMEQFPARSADAVHRAFHLAGAIPDCRDGVRHGESKIVVAVDEMIALSMFLTLSFTL